MYKTDNGLEVYETYEELVNKGITGMWEYQGKYYVRVKLDDYYDNSIWVVDKITGKVSCMFFTDFFDIQDKAKPIDPKTVRRAS